MIGPDPCKTPLFVDNRARAPARGWRRAGTRAGLGAAGLLLMLVPASSQMRGPPASRRWPRS